MKCPPLAEIHDMDRGGIIVRYVDFIPGWIVYDAYTFAVSRKGDDKVVGASHIDHSGLYNITGVCLYDDVQPVIGLVVSAKVPSAPGSDRKWPRSVRFPGRGIKEP